MFELREDGLYATPPLADDPDDPTILERLDIELRTPYALKHFTIDRVDIGEKRIIDTLTEQGLSILANEESEALLKMVLVETGGIVLLSSHTTHSVLQTTRSVMIAVSSGITP